MLLISSFKVGTLSCKVCAPSARIFLRICLAFSALYLGFLMLASTSSSIFDSSIDSCGDLTGYSWNSFEFANSSWHPLTVKFSYKICKYHIMFSTSGPSPSYLFAPLYRYNTVPGHTTRRKIKKTIRIFTWFSFFKRKLGIAMATCIYYYPSGLPNLRQDSFTASSSRQFFAFVIRMNLAAAYASSGFLSGWYRNVNFLLHTDLNFYILLDN